MPPPVYTVCCLCRWPGKSCIFCWLYRVRIPKVTTCLWTWILWPRYVI